MKSFFHVIFPYFSLRHCKVSNIIVGLIAQREIAFAGFSVIDDMFRSGPLKE